jgi:uncharacterized protein (DUF58 family)
MATPRPATSRFLSPEVVSGLSSIELKARTVVEGLLLGLHRSPFRGASVEFAEYRQYLPGDDPAMVDWKVFARSDRHYVKKFELDTNVEASLLVDVSASMGYVGDHGMSKLEYASCLAASLAYLLTGQRDAVGVSLFDAALRDHVPPSSRPGQLTRLLVALERARPGAVSDTAAALAQVAERIRRRGLVVVFSDLLDDPERVIAGLRLVRARGMEVVVFQLLDEHELTLPFEHASTFRDMETGQQVLTDPRSVRQAYLEAMAALQETYRRELRAAGIDYQMTSTATPLDVALLGWLGRRGRTL